MAIESNNAGAQWRVIVIAYFKVFQGTKLYDFLTAAPLIAWYGLCVMHQLPPLAQQITERDLATVDIIFIASLFSKLATLIFVAVLGILLILRHTPLGKTQGIFPRFAALAGTYLGVGMVILPPQTLSLPLQLISTLLILGGTVFALYAALGLGRSISMLPEARRLVTWGPYAVIRHPLYLGEAVALLGLTLQFLSPWALAIFVLQSIFQLERMKNEEKILSNIFPKYRDYMAHTARLLPGLY